MPRVGTGGVTVLDRWNIFKSDLAPQGQDSSLASSRGSLGPASCSFRHWELSSPSETETEIAFWARLYFLPRDPLRASVSQGKAVWVSQQQVCIFTIPQPPAAHLWLTRLWPALMVSELPSNAHPPEHCH